MEISLTSGEKGTLLSAAREAIVARLENRSPRYDPVSDSLTIPRGAFVTLHAEGALRGCIGHIVASDPLVETVREMAVAAAFHDPRFPPLALDELPAVSIEISVLGPLERVAKIDEIIVGEHGLYVKKGGFSGVLLPQVAPEQGWDVPAFLAYTCRKAGLRRDAWSEPDTEVFRFCAEVFGEAARHPPEKNGEN